MMNQDFGKIGQRTFELLDSGLKMTDTLTTVCKGPSRWAPRPHGNGFIYA